MCVCVLNSIQDTGIRCCLCRTGIFKTPSNLMALNRISDRTSFATLRTRANMATPMMGFVDDREETRGNREISSQILFSEPWTRD